MKNKNSLTIVIFGATGNLYSDKLAKALYLLFLGGQLPEMFNIVAFARKDLNDNEFRAFTKESILKRGDIDLLKIEDFLSRIYYFKGDLNEKMDFVELKEFITKLSPYKNEAITLLHLATTSDLYGKIFDNMKYAEFGSLGEKTRILIEKPFGKNEVSAEELELNISEIFKKENIFHVDHYLAKETTKNISGYALDKENLEKIKIIFYESNVVGSRGASYDTVGAFKDVGQNHMLELLALSIMDKSESLDREHVHMCRVRALEDLYVDDNEKRTRGQYEGYLSEPGVNINSTTETFFRIFLKSKDKSLSDIKLELEGGKGLRDMHSDITTTTVAIEIYFKKGTKKEFKIQPVAGTVYESYTNVYIDAINNNQANFVSIEEIISEWKINDELNRKWKNTPLIIYKKGSKAEDII